MYVKIFQALSGSSEIGTPELRELLNQYSDNVPFDENEVDYDDLLTSLNSVGNTYPELAIQHLNPKPFHSGTVSIVYEAELKTGQPIVVKVIRPNGLARMKQALKETMGLLRIINLIPKFRQLSLTSVIRENQPVLEDQFCTYTELSNLQQYAQHFADDDEIIIPKVYPEFTKRNEDILVMERLYGKKVADVLQEEKDDYGELIAKQSIVSLVKHGIYHGDLHSGNVLFTTTDSGKKALALLDFGIVGYLSEHERLILSSFYMSIGLGNYEDAVDTMLISLSDRDKFNNLPLEKRQDINAKLVVIAKDAFTTSKGFGADELGSINRILSRDGLALAPVFCRIELALAMAASVSKELETESCDMMSHIRCFIQKSLDVDVFDV